MQSCARVLCPITSRNWRSRLLQRTGCTRPQRRTRYGRHGKQVSISNARYFICPHRSSRHRRRLASPKTGGETVRVPLKLPACPFAILKLTCCCKSASGRLRLRRYNRLVATDHRLMGTILPVGEERKKEGCTGTRWLLCNLCIRAAGRPDDPTEPPWAATPASARSCPRSTSPAWHSRPAPSPQDRPSGWHSGSCRPR